MICWLRAQHAQRYSILSMLAHRQRTGRYAWHVATRHAILFRALLGLPVASTRLAPCLRSTLCLTHSIHFTACCLLFCCHLLVVVIFIVQLRVEMCPLVVCSSACIFAIMRHPLTLLTPPNFCFNFFCKFFRLLFHYFSVFFFSFVFRAVAALSVATGGQLGDSWATTIDICN